MQKITKVWKRVSIAQQNYQIVNSPPLEIQQGLSPVNQSPTHPIALKIKIRINQIIKSKKLKNRQTRKIIPSPENCSRTLENQRN